MSGYTEMRRRGETQRPPQQGRFETSETPNGAVIDPSKTHHQLPPEMGDLPVPVLPLGPRRPCSPRRPASKADLGSLPTAAASGRRARRKLAHWFWMRPALHHGFTSAGCPCPTLCPWLPCAHTWGDPSSARHIRAHPSTAPRATPGDQSWTAPAGRSASGARL
jgi:hypothetical protein